MSSKKELRLAIVIYGGASLAIYMHGVTKELLKLVRASKVLHELGPDQSTIDYADCPDHRAFDTEAVYFDMLKEINATTHFRVVIDIVAGASAGAINGVMLSKAIVDDALLDAQTAAWLSDADVEFLSREETSKWRKWYLYPMLKGLSLALPKEITSNEETRTKLERLVRSSWFEPPLSGTRLCEHFFDALEALKKTRRPGSSLLPAGQRLDMYASITDLVGYPNTIRMHDHLVARENAHSAYCSLSHQETEVGRERSDFNDDNVPALVWAARASSSYAGVFPPFHHSEMRDLLLERDIRWPREHQFLSSRLYNRDGAPLANMLNPADRYFVDGGIVNNKPFASALEALNHRPADRPVDRCIVYIEPDPKIDEPEQRNRNLGYLSTIRAALSSIPRNQPILEDLKGIVALDERVQVNVRVVEENQEHILRVVAELREPSLGEPLTLELLGYLRRSMVDRTADELSLAYKSYVQRRVWRLTGALVDEWMLLAGDANWEQTRAAMTASVEQWWKSDDTASDWSRHNLQDGFLDRFDVTFRIRRLQFVIRRLNQHEHVTTLDDESAEALDLLKEQAYGLMETFYEVRKARLSDLRLIQRLAEAARYVPLEREAARALLLELSGSMNLNGIDREVDSVFVEFCERSQDDDIRESLLADYVGFPFYDVLLMTPRTLDGGPDPLTPLRVERISPADSHSLTDTFTGLKSRTFMGFLGFFNRDYREHDYLWGRLNAADRIVDLLINAVGDCFEDPDSYRRRLFQAIVARERQRLYRCSEELDRIDERVRSDRSLGIDPTRSI